MSVGTTRQRVRRAETLLDASVRSRWPLRLISLLLVGTATYLGGAGLYSIAAGTIVAVGLLVLTGVPFDIRRDRIVLAGAIAIGVTLLQILPLPPFLVRALDSDSASLSGGALDALQIGRQNSWRPLALDPGNTLADLLYFVGIGSAYLAARQIASRGYADTIRVIARYATLWIASVAMVHRLLGLDRVFSVYRPEAAAPPILSPLLNPNHLAAYCATGLILWLGYAFVAESPPQRVLRLAGAALCGVPCALSLSRGGVAAALGGVLALSAAAGVTTRRRRRGSSRQSFAALGAAALVVALGAYAGSAALKREYADGDLGKISIILGTLRTLRSHWLLGVGSGGLHAAAHAIGVAGGQATVTRAESLPVDLVIALGPIAGLAVLALLCGWAWNYRPRLGAWKIPVVATYTAVVFAALHDLFDFSLWFGANGFLVATLAGSLSGEMTRAGTPRPVERRTRRTVLLPVALVAVAITILFPRTKLDDDRTQLRSGLSERSVSDSFITAAMLRHPGDPYIPLGAAVRAIQLHRANALRFLNRAMLIAPSWAEPHLLLSQFMFAEGLRSQALVEFRLAMSLSPVHHYPAAPYLLGTVRDSDEIGRAIPNGRIGRAFLQTLATQAGNSRWAPAIDDLILARDPSDPEAVMRVADRAARIGDPHAIEIYRAALHRDPRNAVAATGLSRMLEADHQPNEAARVVIEALQAGADRATCLTRIAEIRAATGDTDGMRRSMNELLEMAGSDVDQRVRLLGLLGQLELQLRHEAAALAAFERGDAMAAPDHPYLEQIVRAAEGLGDQRRLHAACLSLSELGTVPPELMRSCNGVRTTPSSSP